MAKSKGPARSAAKARAWRERIAQWRASGLGVRAFCTRHQLSEPSFYAWRRELASRAKGTSVRRKATKRAARPTFAAVELIVPDSMSGAVEIRLRTGQILRADADVDAEHLARLASALERASC